MMDNYSLGRGLYLLSLLVVWVFDEHGHGCSLVNGFEVCWYSAFQEGHR